MTTETWLPVLGFEGLYEASDLGRVRSLAHVSVTKNRWGSIRRRFPGRVLRDHIGPGGYLQVTLCDGVGGRHQRTVHSIIAEAFLGPRTEGNIVLHADGVKLNCAANNLRYGTHRQNSADAISHGDQPRGDRHGHAKLTDDIVALIRSLVGTVTYRAMAARFGVTPTAIRLAAIGNTWTHIPMEKSL